MEYLYEVFISHNLGKINEQWQKEIFLRLFGVCPYTELPHAPDKLVEKGILFSLVGLTNLLRKAADCAYNNYSSSKEAAPCLKMLISPKKHIHLNKIY